MALYNRRYCICSNTLSVFIDHVCFANHEHVFLANTSKFCIFIFTIRCCIFLHIMTLSIVHGKICLQFTCIFCMFAIHARHRTVEKGVKNFGVLGVSGLNKQGQNARRGFSHGIPHDNDMQVKQDGNLQKRQYTQTILHFFIFCHFF